MHISYPHHVIVILQTPFSHQTPASFAHFAHRYPGALPPVLRLALGFVGAQLQALHLDLRRHGPC